MPQDAILHFGVRFESDSFDERVDLIERATPTCNASPSQ